MHLFLTMALYNILVKVTQDMFIQLYTKTNQVCKERVQNSV